MNSLFFGYGSESDLLRETLYQAANRAGDLHNVVNSVSWEDLRVDGKLIVNEVESAIQASNIALFELSALNLNVLYELGYAVAQEKQVVILLDEQDREAVKRFKDFSLLSTTGWSGYRNPDHLVAQIAQLTSTPQPALWDELLKGIEAPVNHARVLYVPSLKEDDASRRVSRTLDRYSKFHVQTIPLEETINSPLAWYAQELYQARYAVFHFTPSRAYLSEHANPQIALFAGLARGLGRKILLIIEEDEDTPIDYRDLALHYRNAAHLENRITSWIEGLHEPSRQDSVRVKRHISAELSTLKFGHHLAEWESDELHDYFFETRDYRDVLDGAAVIFTGKKGTGKTANMLQAADALAQDSRNLVCTVVPASYEIEGLLEVLRRIDARHLSQYLIEGLWKYLIYTEIASKAVQDAEGRPAGILTGSPLDDLRNCLTEHHQGVDASLSTRLERIVESLQLLLDRNEDLEKNRVEDSRKKVASAIYGTTLAELRKLLGRALASRNRVAILIDNLDKAWERGADLELLSKLIMGLLTIVERIVDEFRRENPRKESANVTLAVFLRSDIFAFVRDNAREPDKITVAEIEWRDDDLLARVLEDRFLAARDGKSTADELWTRYFAPEVKGISSRNYILSRVQKRPRDLIFFSNAAVGRASNAKHDVISESDMLEAENDYSHFAYDSLLVEGYASGINLDTYLMELAGEDAVLASSKLYELIASCGEAPNPEVVITMLRKLGFLGIEVADGQFDYGGTEAEIKRANVLSRKFEKASDHETRYEVYPAYRSYLALSEPGAES